MHENTKNTQLIGSFNGRVTNIKLYTCTDREKSCSKRLLNVRLAINLKLDSGAGRSIIGGGGGQILIYSCSA